MRELSCKHVARMMPLYVAGDLIRDLDHEVARHLAACEECRRLAEEFSEISGLLIQACAPPKFDPEFYSGIRRGVLGEIKRDRILAKPSLFRRRWLYATAIAAVVVSFLVVLRLGGPRRHTSQDLSVAELLVQPTPGQTKRTESSATSQSSDLPRSRRESQVLPGTPKVHSHKFLALGPPRGSSRQFEKVRKPYASDTGQRSLDERTQIGEIAQALRPSMTVAPTVLSGASASSPAGRGSPSPVSQIEIQTANPNVRIIWLARREARESEGTIHDHATNENGNRN
jgi:hypothetical protein